MIVGQTTGQGRQTIGHASAVEAGFPFGARNRFVMPVIQWRISSVITSAFIALLLFACSMNKNEVVQDASDYEHRDIEVNSLDLKILQRADAILSSKAHWSKDPSIKCADLPQPGKIGFVDGHDVLATKYNLYCALEIATAQTVGSFLHQYPAIQEVRFTIADNYPMRWKKHRLLEFNAHPDTTFKDVKNVIYITIARVKQKIARAHSHESSQ